MTPRSVNANAFFTDFRISRDTTIAVVRADQVPSGTEYPRIALPKFDLDAASKTIEEFGVDSSRIENDHLLHAVVDEDSFHFGERDAIDGYEEIVGDIPIDGLNPKDAPPAFSLNQGDQRANPLF